LISNITLIDVVGFSESNLEHGNHSAELKMIETFNEWLVFINDGDVADFVDLMKTHNSVLDEFGKINC